MTSTNVSNGGEMSIRLSEMMTWNANCHRPWFSLEFFLPYTESGSEDLIGMVDYFVKSRPLFYSIVSKGANQSTGHNRSPSADIDMANVMVNFCGVETVLHVCWMNETVEGAKTRLQAGVKNGVRTLFVIRGDAPRMDEVSGNGFKSTVDFIKFVRKEFGDKFCIGVAGYPEGHPDSKSYRHCLEYLKAKVAAGADFVLTQFFYNSSLFVNFYRDCRSIGIKCPIIPSILPITSYNSIMRIIDNSRVTIPQDILKTLESLKSDDENVERFGIELTTKLCREIIASNLVPGLHFCTLNRRTTMSALIDRLELSIGSLTIRDLPWRQSAKLDRRMNEMVRPIFWAARPKSYMYRSSGWEQFPNGRWGNPSLASFRDVD
ncbi:hypothetical protein ACOME3_000653 [Neoechinorhynchus agilis]